MDEVFRTKSLGRSPTCSTIKFLANPTESAFAPPAFQGYANAPALRSCLRQPFQSGVGFLYSCLFQPMNHNTHNLQIISRKMSYIRKFFDEELSAKMKEMVEKRFPVSESEE